MTGTDVMVAGWLDGTAENSPAGPLFIGGEYAESEIVARAAGVTATLCTACTVTMAQGFGVGRICC